MPYSVFILRYLSEERYLDHVFEIEGLFSKEKGQVPILNYVPFHSTRTPVTKQGIRFTIFVVKQKIASYCV